MQLMTEELKQEIPAIYAQSKSSDPIVYAKFFDPGSNWTWYVTEFDGDDEFYGLVKGQFEEMGNFSLKALQSHRGRLGIGIERDLHFTPCPLSQARKQ